MSNIEELKGLAELKEQGILTEEEFQKEKEKILSRGSKTEEESPKSTPEPGTSGKKSSGWFRTGKSAEDKREKAIEDKMQSDPRLQELYAKMEKDAEDLKKQGEKLDDLLGL